LERFRENAMDYSGTLRGTKVEGFSIDRTEVIHDDEMAKRNEKRDP
jgi:hypothetical protein